VNPTELIAIVLAPLIAASIAGLFGRRIGRSGAHSVTIAGVAISFLFSAHVLWQIYWRGVPAFDAPVYTWLVSDGVPMQVGFLIDRLSALMMAVVTFVSLCVHVYTVGYMSDDPGYQRFFCYISLFTFGMLMLVMANNFMQLFFGWEAVGLMSYLLIGFWYTRPTAIAASLKAFLVNRVGDFGFVLGIAGVLYYMGSLHYADVFRAAPLIATHLLPLGAATAVPAMTLICICLFIGAMGKSAQVPLHVWLPDSMEGPTPISALIHAATMVTAGIFMVARMSPLFEYSDTALSFVLIIGATTAFFMGALGVVNNDIKRVIAYSTLSQLGYMTVALGASAYSAAIFHLMTHAFFKALLFLAAGSVIIGMHHEQDMRKMGGLAKYMPITAITAWIGSLALIGTPFFSGFYSKDTIIEAVGASQRWGARYAYYCVFAGVFITALYTFRMLFKTFHGPEHFREVAHHDAEHGDEPGRDGGHQDAHSHVDPHESPAVITVPLIALAIPSVVIGFLTIGTILYGNYFGDSIFVLPQNAVMKELAREYHGPVQFALHALTAPTFWVALAGVITAWFFFLYRPDLADKFAHHTGVLGAVLRNRYYFDWFNEKIIAAGALLFGRELWHGGDQSVIDGVLVDGTASTIGRAARLMRRMQSGYLYSYAFWMIIGLALLLGWFLNKSK
jgi:NADH-quinone oxidoreductase subunit L